MTNSIRATITALRNDALKHGDYDQVVLCVLALDGEVDADDWCDISDRVGRMVRTLDQGDAIALCLKAVA